MEFKYLLFLRNNKVRVCNLRKEKLEVIRFSGEEYCPYHKDFWQIWKKKVGYAKEKADILLISDSPDFKLSSEIHEVEETSWTIKELESFIMSHVEFQSLKKIEDVLEIQGDGDDTFTFFYHISGGEFQNCMENDEPDIMIEPEEPVKKSDLARYFLNKKNGEAKRS